MLFLRATILSTLVPSALATTYYGCYIESTKPRALNSTSYDDYSHMTVEACQKFCTNASMPLFGLEYGGECYCGAKLSVGAISTFSSQCNTPCAGNKAQTCGGSAHLSLYGASPGKPAETPVAHPEVNQFAYVGCFAENASGVPRALPGGTVADQSEMTVTACGRFCLNRGFLVFGLEYKNECYCGTVDDRAKMKRATEADCSMACSGASDQTCGGSSRLGVYQWYDGQKGGRFSSV
jgi:WSC domain